MLDYSIAQTVRNSVVEAMVDLKAEDKDALPRLAIAFEVKSTPRRDEPSKKRESFSNLSTWSQNSDDAYVQFLSDQVHFAHDRLRSSWPIDNMRWGKNQIYIDHCILKPPEDYYDYSVIVGIAGDNNPENKKILNEIMRSIKAIRP